MNADLADARATVARSVETNAQRLLELSHKIHDNPELGFEETRGSEWVAEALEASGFKVERGVAELPTAFRATFGDGSLNVGICAEYDALPGIGHACGHNIIAASAVGAAAALTSLAAEMDLTVTVLGTPAEEGGGGKVFMLQRGAFDGLHAAMMVHPSRIERDVMPTLATSQWNVEYFGKSAHAAAAPERGISASAAMALAQVGIGMLREHFRSGDRVHGIVRDGGNAPNIVPEHTLGTWFVRSDTLQHRDELEKRIVRVFEGAAMMTGCRLEIKPMSPPYTEIRSDERIAGLWRANAAELGRNSLAVGPGDGPASTDMGNVSYAMPSIHPLIAIDSDTANIHEPAFADAAISTSADDTIRYAATCMAQTILDIACDAELRSSLSKTPFCVADVPASENAFLSLNYDNPIVFTP